MSTILEVVCIQLSGTSYTQKRPKRYQKQRTNDRKLRFQ